MVMGIPGVCVCVCVSVLFHMRAFLVVAVTSRHDAVSRALINRVTRRLPSKLSAR